MTDAELTESLDHHFLACPSLSNIQLAQHRESETCPDCGPADRPALVTCGARVTP